jgi:hypothetical protein
VIVREAIASGQLLAIIRTVDANERVYTRACQELATSSLETLTSGLCKDPNGRSYFVFVWRFALEMFLNDIKAVVQRYLLSNERSAFVLSGSETASIPAPKASSRGRKRKWDWEGAKQACWKILEHHGAPDSNDPDLPNQAALERKVQKYFAAHNGGDAPVESQVRDYVGLWLNEYSEAKKQGQ